MEGMEIPFPEMPENEPAATPVKQAPQPDYSGPPAIPVHDAMTQARSAGFDWGSIERQVNDPQVAALSAGYSGSEIDRYLGFPSPQAHTDRLAVMAQKKAAAEPAGEQKAGLEGNDTGKQTPHSAAPVELSADDRSEYANSLLNGETKGPSDFVSSWVDAHSPHGLPTNLAPNQLPSHAELVDYSLALLNDNGLPINPASVRATKQNLADAWAVTGKPVGEIYRQSQNNGSLSDGLTRPQPAAPGVPAPATPTFPVPEVSQDTVTRASALVGANKDDPRVSAYLRAGGMDVNPDKTAWCAAYVNATLAQSGIKGSGSLVATSFDNWGTPVDTASTRRGDVLVLNRGRSAGETGGHVGIATGETRQGPKGLQVQMVSGNSDNGGVDTTWYDANQVVARRAGMPSGDTIRQGFLDHISSSEGANYGTLYGGGSMKGMDRDETGFPIWSGKDNSHAAGRYQFEPATWKEEYTKLGLTGGMTPENQDAAAWDLAQTRYKSVTGRDLSADLTNGDKGSQISDALHGTWTSLGKPGVTTASFANAVGGAIKTVLDAPEHAIDFGLQHVLGSYYTDPVGSWLKNAREVSAEEEANNEAMRGKSLAERALNPHDIDKAISSVFAGEMGVEGAGAEGVIKGTAKATEAAPAAAAPAPTSSSTWGNLFTTPEQRAASAAYATGKDVAQSSIVRETGLARQEQARAAAELKGFHRLVNGELPEYQRWLDTTAQQDVRIRRDNALDLQDHITNMPYTGQTLTDFKPKQMVEIPAVQQLIDHVEGVPGAALTPDHPMFELAQGLKKVYSDTKDAIVKGGYDTSSFPDDYYRHMWQDQAATDKVIGSGGRQGSSASLRQRTIPTINDGLAAGLKPKILDPIENTLNYVSGMRSFLAAQDVLKEGEAQGQVAWSFGGPPVDGWEALKGSGATRAVDTGLTQRAYAQPGYASSYNNWVGRGFYDWGAKAGNVLDKVQAVSNGMTGMKLSLSGYHAMAMTQESLAAGIANAVGDLARGQFLEAGKQLGLTFTLTKPIRDVWTGGKLTNQYLGIADYGKGEVADLYARAGGRVGSRGEEYGGSNLGNLYTKLRDGMYTASLASDFKAIAGKVDEAILPRAMMTVPRAAGFVLRQVQDVLGSLTAPLFDYAIPRIKFANFADEMQSWLKANPTADQMAKENYARTIQRSMDDRFGEMVQDNLFWKREIKQALNTSVVSVGWEFGTLRAFGGAVKDIMHGDILSPRARWVMGFAAATGYIGAIYQYLKTGSTPGSTNTPWLDMLAPRNGTTNDDGSVGRSILPGYQKDPLQWYKEFTSNPLTGIGTIMEHKLNPFAQTVTTGLLGGHTWMGTPISSSYRGEGGHSIGTGILPNSNYSSANPKAPPPWWTAYGDYVAEQVTPIGIEQMNQKAGRLNPLEKGLGIRPAPSIVGDAATYAKSQEIKNKIEEQQGLQYSRWQNKQLQTPDTTVPMAKPRGEPRVPAGQHKVYEAPATPAPPTTGVPEEAPAQPTNPDGTPFKRSHHKIGGGRA